MKYFERMLIVSRLFWKYSRVIFQLLRGAWKVSKLDHPSVTVYGGKFLKKESVFSQKAFELGKKLARRKISIVTGGGPGVMEAATCGAIESDGKDITTIGIGVSYLTVKELFNPCAKYHYLTDYLSIRKLLLLYYSHAFVVFPGGFGTMDEIFEVLVLMQTKRLPQMPIIFVGVEYWKDLFAWMEKAVSEGLLERESADLIMVTDSVDEVVDKVSSYCFSPECEQWQHRQAL